MPEFEFNRFYEQAKAELLQSGEDFLPSMHLFTENRMLKVDLVPHFHDGNTQVAFFAEILPEIIKQEKVFEFILIAKKTVDEVKMLTAVRVTRDKLFMKILGFKVKKKKVVLGPEEDFGFDRIGKDTILESAQKVLRRWKPEEKRGKA